MQEHVGEGDNLWVADTKDGAFGSSPIVDAFCRADLVSDDDRNVSQLEMSHDPFKLFSGDETVVILVVKLELLTDSLVRETLLFVL